MDIKEKLKQRFNVPENWDKHDYAIHRYSFDDLLEAAELVKESYSLPPVIGCDHNFKPHEHTALWEFDKCTKCGKIS